MMKKKKKTIWRKRDAWCLLCDWGIWKYKFRFFLTWFKEEKQTTSIWWWWWWCIFLKGKCTVRFSMKMIMAQIFVVVVEWCYFWIILIIIIISNGCGQTNKKIAFFQYSLNGNTLFCHWSFSFYSNSKINIIIDNGNGHHQADWFRMQLF